MEALASSLRLSPAVASKANELFRLAESKGSSSMQEGCLRAVCLHLACRTLSEPFDKEQIQKKSGMSGKKYTKHFQFVEKLLKLECGVTLRDLMIKFDCLEAKETAQEILSSYKHYFASKYTDRQFQSNDFSSPLHLAVALYISCSLMKIRIDQGELIKAASTSRTSFRSVHEEMKKSVPESLVEKIKGVKGKKKQKKDKDTTDKPDDTEGNEDKDANTATDDGGTVYLDHPVHFQLESWESRCLSNPFTKEFEKWKTEMLAKASSDKELK